MAQYGSGYSLLWIYLYPGIQDLVMKVKLEMDSNCPRSLVQSACRFSTSWLIRLAWSAVPLVPPERQAAVPYLNSLTRRWASPPAPSKTASCTGVGWRPRSTRYDAVYGVRLLVWVVAFACSLRFANCMAFMSVFLAHTNIDEPRYLLIFNCC